jgi:hypothetical protein
MVVRLDIKAKNCFLLIDYFSSVYYEMFLKSLRVLVDKHRIEHRAHILEDQLTKGRVSNSPRYKAGNPSQLLILLGNPKHCNKT